MSVTPKWAMALLGAMATATLATLATTSAPAQAAKRPAARPTGSFSRVERSFAGIRLGTRATTLVKMIGQPTEIQLGAGNGGADASGLDSTFGGGFGGSGMPGGFGAPMPGGPPMAGGPPMGGGYMPGGPSLGPGGPPMPGGSPFPSLPPVGGGNPFAPGAPGGDMSGQDQSGQLAVTYVYRNFRHRPNFTLTVQIDEDGRVVQIVGTSLNPVPGVATARNIGFGTAYSTVLGRYGWPQAHTAAGNFIQANYQDTAHVAFQFLNGKVVRVVVAEVE